MPLCQMKIALMSAAQKALTDLAELMHRQREAIASESENTLLAIDREIEVRLGEKERAMGALQQHRKEHGC